MAVSGYRFNPSPTNADRAFAELTPELIARIDIVNQNIARDAVDKTYPMLDMYIRAGDRSTVRLGFKLLGPADSVLAEKLCTSLGALIRPMPRFFLEQYTEFREYLPKDGSVLLQLGHEFLGQDEARCAEYALRAKAFDEILDSDLSVAQQECIVFLRSACK